MILPDVSAGYGAALLAMLKRIESEFRNYDRRALPIRMVIAGGTALYLHTGERVTEDVDATCERLRMRRGPAQRADGLALGHPHGELP